MDEVEAPPPPWFEDGLKFKCTGCGKCCTGSPGYVFLSPTDVQRLSSHLNMEEADFMREKTRYVDGQYSLLEKGDNYDCIFFEDKKCTVYEARPSQCRTFPWWLHHLREPKDWEQAALRCEGINHPDAPVVDSLHIQHECLTYLDNLIEQNFFK